MTPFWIGVLAGAGATFLAFIAIAVGLAWWMDGRDRAWERQSVEQSK